MAKDKNKPKASSKVAAAAGKMARSTAEASGLAASGAVKTSAAAKNKGGTGAPRTSAGKAGGAKGKK
jgi:hypothetical protein